eukprot:TRINITY_DN6978_c0_g1_i3.p1 TRINITY_DN6978_c0_g1~~TRINITY_DN6978_c0_g1_i3.p1  ORF type:complete len:574 (-),score=126.51 TRINITY_DN6978_c0_g1_i3:286-2007(-)
MVLLCPSEFRAAWQEIKSKSSSGTCSVILFLARDVDSLATAHTLEALLRADHVLYQMVPVSGYQELQEEWEEYQKTDEINSVVLINCGGLYDLGSHWTLQPDLNVYVLDSHRPIRYENVTNSKIIVLDDGSSADALARLDEDDDRRTRRKVGDDGEFVEEEPSSPRTRARKRNKLFKDYYTGTYYGPCSASIAYTLAQQLNRSDQQLLWLAIVGLTEQFLHQRISRDKYVQMVSEYQDEVARLCNDAQEGSSNPAPTDAPVVEKHAIKFEEEYPFTLYRHWNLWDSVRHSRYIATKLEVWTTNGQKLLTKLFAKMGISLEDAKQQWTHMNPEAKASLQKYIDEVGKELGFPDLFYGSFVLKQGYRFCISAADVVEGVTAMLAQSSDDRESGDESHHLRRNFWIAHDALSSLESTKKIEEGLDFAMQLQEAILKNASHMVLKKNVTTSGVFRYAYLKDSADVQIFVNPHSLTALAEFLASFYKEKNPTRKPKPFVLCALDEVRGTYLLVAVDGTVTTTHSGVEDQMRNKFGTSFAKAAERTNARVKHDGFDSSIIEIQKDDIYNFMEFLHSGLC